jgi:hypothetical protein
MLPLLIVTAAMIAGCTATKLDGSPPGAEAARQLQIGAIRTAYASTLEADRASRAESLGLAQTLSSRIETWMRETSRWGGGDLLSVEIDQFRLPGPGTRWLTAGAKGNDYLGAEVVVTQIGAPTARFHVEQTLGAGDRSIAENYSGDRAFENLIDAVAWSIVHAITPFEKRRAIFEIGKREHIREAINMLEQCGELSYAEAIKYGMLGKMYASNEVSAEYRRVKRFFGARPPQCY